jgi:hypothetical protein
MCQTDGFRGLVKTSPDSNSRSVSSLFCRAVWEPDIVFLFLLIFSWVMLPISVIIRFLRRVLPGDLSLSLSFASLASGRAAIMGPIIPATQGALLNTVWRWQASQEDGCCHALRRGGAETRANSASQQHFMSILVTFPLILAQPRYSGRKLSLPRELSVAGLCHGAQPLLGPVNRSHSVCSGSAPRSALP